VPKYREILAFYFRRNLAGQRADIYVSYRIAHPVAIDIKPGSSPNPLNLGIRGMLPVAVLGSDDLDVAEIDVATQLAGVNPVRSSYEDVATAVNGGNECDCTEEGGDGIVNIYDFAVIADYWLEYAAVDY
jgi:hypothetical protein